MIWNVDLADELEAEWDELPGDVQDELLAHGKLLEQFGPQLGRPRVDTLKGSRYGNMKELRFDAAHGVWCVVCGVWCVVCGAWPSPSILVAGRCCSSPATNPVPRNADFIDN